MRIGPISPLDLPRLLEVLDKNSSKYTILTEDRDQPKINQVELQPAEAGIHLQTPHKLSAYIDLDLENVDIIKNDLLRLGIDISQNNIFLDEKVEYVCPICKKTSFVDGICELHKCELLTHRELNEYQVKKKFENKRGRSIWFESLSIISILITGFVRGFEKPYYYMIGFLALIIIQKLKYQKKI